MTAEQLNSILRRAERRALELEDRMVALLVPVLRRQGQEAAERFEARATNFLTAGAARELRGRDKRALARLGPVPAARLLRSLALTAAAPGVTSSSTMVCLKPTPEQAAALAVEGGEPTEFLHVTLAYLGEIDGDLGPVVLALQRVAAEHGHLTGEVGGAGRFGAVDGISPSILLPDVPGLVELRVSVTDALVCAGIDYARSHGFAAHVTVDYAANPEAAADKIGLPLTFTDLYVVRGDTEVIPIPLLGAPPLTAAAAPPQWASPTRDELVDVDELVATLRSKTDPVRLATIETVMTETLNGAGLAWDVTNPLTSEVLAQSGSQVVHIAETTQLNVMKIIDVAYNEGLSIPDTAKAIRVGMADAAGDRARVIARTEIAGAVNGGSLAATKIVSEETGIRYTKTWLTAPGAKWPRHETYIGLNEQTVGMDDYFTVGSSSLRYPADPAGAAHEVIQCRCTMIYEEAEGAHPQPAHPSEARGPELTDGPASEMLTKGAAKWKRSLTDDHRDALWAYRTKEGFMDINSKLRGGNPQPALRMFHEPGDPYTPKNNVIELDRAIELIDETIATAAPVDAPLGLTLFRGVEDVHKAFGPGGPKVGGVLEEKAYVSTTTEVDVARMYGKIVEGGARWTDERPTGALYEVHVPEGTRGAWMPSVKAKFDDNNMEYVLARGQQFRVTEVETRTRTARRYKGTEMEDFDEEYLHVKMDLVEAEPLLPSAGEALQVLRAGEFDDEDLIVETLDWADEAADVAGAAITEASQGTGELFVLRDAQQALTAVANVERGNDALIVRDIASGGGGQGTVLLRQIAGVAANESKGVRLVATPDAVSYYQRFPELVQTGREFHLPAEKARAFAQGGEKVVVVTETVVVETGGVVEDAYLVSLRAERSSTMNKINGLLAKEKRGTMTDADYGRLEALRKRLVDVRALIKTPDPKAELSRVNNQLSYMRRLVRDGTATAETNARLALLEARKTELAGLTKSGTFKQTEDLAKTARVAEAKKDAPKTTTDKPVEERAAALDPNSAASIAQHYRDRTGEDDWIVIPPHQNYSAGHSAEVSAYEARECIAWEHNGVVVKVELRAGEDPGTIRREKGRILNGHIDDIPPEMQGRLEKMESYIGHSPSDAYWAARYKGFTTCGANGGNGLIVGWHGTTLSTSSFRHELGHVVGEKGGPLYPDEWRAAAGRDAASAKKNYGSDATGGGEGFLVGNRSVSTYGSNSDSEDWAESIRLYLQDRKNETIGSVSYKRADQFYDTEKVRFADVFPGRARLIERWLQIE